MKKYLLTALIVLVAHTVLAQSARAVDASTEEYDVYSAVIADWFAGTHYDRIVIQNVTESNDVTIERVNRKERYFARMFPALKNGVARDYNIRNKEPLRFKDSLELKMEYVLIDEKEIEKVFKNRTWGEFYKKYPNSGGLVSLSRPGFNSGMNQALIYRQYWCGWLCGGGDYLLLKKSSGRWTIVKEHTVWVS